MSAESAADPVPGEKITIFDTTLRDGEQSPGCSMNTAEKLEVAKALVELGVDVIEAGFPIASPGDFEAVQKIAREFGDRTVICGLARCRPDDIDRAWEALQDAEKKRIHVFLATSSIHREFKLKMAKEEIVRTTIEMVSRAKNYCDNIEFSPEDAARTELDFLSRSRREGHRSRGHDGQHSRHRRLCHAQPIPAGDRALEEERAEHRTKR